MWKMEHYIVYLIIYLKFQLSVGVKVYGQIHVTVQTRAGDPSTIYVQR